MAKSHYPKNTIGLVGCGKWGRLILRDLINLGVVVHVAEPLPEYQDYALKNGANTVCDRLDHLPDVDGLIIATPASTHGTVIKQALEHPVPVFTEKPFTLDLASAQSLAAIAPDRLFIMHIWRYHHGIEMLRQIAQDQVLGKVSLLRSVRTNWTSPRQDCDSIWTLAPHDLSIALEILGYLPEAVSAIAEHHHDRPCGLIGILGKNPSFVLEVSTRYPDKRREVRLHCERGLAILPSIEANYIEIIHDHLEQPERLPLPKEQPLERELRTFLEFINGGIAPKSSASDGVLVVTRMLELRAIAGI